MRNIMIWAVAAWILGAATLSAQTVPTLPEAKPAPEYGVGPTGQPVGEMLQISPGGNSAAQPRVWVRSEYLLWWVKNAPLPIPLVAVTDEPDPKEPLGGPPNRLLLGNSSAGFGAFSGFRLTLGGWLNCERDVGIEGSGFVLERRSSRFYTASDKAGNPLLAFPFFNRTPGAEGEDFLRISDPTAAGQYAGNVLVASSLQLWGAEVNGIACLWRTPTMDFTFLAGFRYLDLQESLRIFNQTNDFSVDPNIVTVLNDRFGTRNQFYGGQIGGRLNWQCNRLDVDLTGKLGLGATHQVVEIQGSTTQSGPFAPTPGTFPGGFFTQPSNIGRFTANQFTVIPAMELKIGYQITPRCRAFAGYDFLYWNQVVRPGNQIDRNINTTQSTVLGTTGGVLQGPASPSPLFNRTDFWAQGVNFGLEFRF
jgi:Putative beta barrel porin-7 (BBP7)